MTGWKPSEFADGTILSSGHLLWYGEAPTVVCVVGKGKVVISKWIRRVLQ